jgi:hypothetical protein
MAVHHVALLADVVRQQCVLHWLCILEGLCEQADGATVILVRGHTCRAIPLRTLAKGLNEPSRE